MNFRYGSKELANIYTVYTPELQALYPFALIVESKNIPGQIELYIFATEATHGYGYLGGGAAPRNAKLRFEYTDTGAWAEPIDETSSAVLGTSYNTLVWANYDVLKADGSVHLAASTPVPVTDTDHNARIMGWIAGKRLAAQRGRA